MEFSRAGRPQSRGQREVLESIGREGEKKALSGDGCRANGSCSKVRRAPELEKGGEEAGEAVRDRSSVGGRTGRSVTLSESRTEADEDPKVCRPGILSDRDEEG